MIANGPSYSQSLVVFSKVATSAVDDLNSRKRSLTSEHPKC